ncbi:MAG TPA: hypothetical protein VKY92_02805 [Verrucomicrobiae bacterium]|nr:hypothetical protein [Verrucomicrobiae bacterium]
MNQQLQYWATEFINDNSTAYWSISGFPRGKVVTVQAIPTDGVPGVELIVPSPSWEKIIDANGDWDWQLDFSVENVSGNSVVYEIWALVTTT